MNWAMRRRVAYAVTSSVTLIAVFLYIYRDTLFPAPTCFDSKMNGYETGVDCGGTCSLMCSQEVNPISEKWTTALRTSSTTYDLVSLIANKNINNSPRGLNYKFTVFDNSGNVALEKSGRTIVPVNSDFPVIIQNVSLSTPPKNTTISFTNEKHYKTFEKPTSPTIRTIDTSFENSSIPKAYVKIQNTKFTTVKNIYVRVILYDSNQNAIGAGETFINSLRGEEQKNLVFTWNYPFLERSPQIKVYPILSPFVPVN